MRTNLQSLERTISKKSAIFVAPMDSSRQKKFSRLIQKELGSIFQQEALNRFDNAFITVADVKITPDLGLARVYLTFLKVPSVAAGLEMVRAQSRYLRGELGHRIGKQARVIPELQFYYDDTLDYAMHIDQVLSKLNIPPEQGEKPS
jgi:ribosome-binding factor A